MNQWSKVAISLGSNLGDRLAFLQRALSKICEDVLESPLSSSVYETKPWGNTDQPNFYNLVIIGETEWKPTALLNYFQHMEKELGRKRETHWGPRVIDLDLLAFAEETIELDFLRVPHPLLEKRGFVLVPFAEVWPEWRHPILGKTCAELLASLSETERAVAKAHAPLLSNTANR